MSPFWHVGIYIGDGWIIESVPISGVRLNRFYLFDNFDAPPWKGATTVFGFRGLCPFKEEDGVRELLRKRTHILVLLMQIHCLSNFIIPSREGGSLSSVLNWRTLSIHLLGMTSNPKIDGL